MRLGTALPIALLAVGWAIPLVYLINNLWGSNFSPAWEWLQTPFASGAIRSALQMAALSTILVLLAAVPIAWLHHVYQFRAQGLALALPAALFLAPVLVIVHAVRSVETYWLPDISPLTAVLLAHVLFEAGFVAIVLARRLAQLHSPRTQILQSFGHSLHRAHWLVAKPVFLRTTLYLGILTFVITLGSYGVVLHLGLPDVYSFETLLASQLRGLYPQTNKAALIGAIQILLTAGLFFAYLRRTDDALESPAWVRKRRAPVAVQVVTWAWFGMLLLPLLALVWQSVHVRGEWTLDAWRAVWAPSHHWQQLDYQPARAMGWMFTYAATSALLVLASLGFIGTSIWTRGRARLWNWLTSLPFLTSSLLVGFSMNLAYGPKGLIFVQQAWWMLPVAHAVLALPFAARMILPAWSARSRQLDELLVSHGVVGWRRWWHAHIRPMRGIWLQAAGFTMALSMADYGASVLLSHPERRSFAIWLLEHETAFAPHTPTLQAAFALSSLAWVAVTLGLTHYLGNKS